jgi:hypothetical protein
MFGIDTTLSGLKFCGLNSQRSRRRVNAGLNDFHPVGMIFATPRGAEGRLSVGVKFHFAFAAWFNQNGFTV